MASSTGTIIDGDLPKFGPFDVICNLDHGSMARVWRAWDSRLQREVAIKEPLFDSNFDPSQREMLVQRFLIEGRAVARLSHPNIVTIHSADVYSGVPVIVMEYIDGTTLFSLLKDWGRLNPDFALSLLSQLLDAVGYAHTRGVVHRDIKPGNIFITHDGTLKLGDFGIAHMENTVDGTITEAGAIVGTPGYMSPEQVNGTPVDARSDIFSIGVVAYEMFTGKNPFGATDGASVATLLHRTANEQPNLETNKLLCRYAPEHVARAIIAALEKRPEMRPQSAEEFKALLTRDSAPSEGQSETVVDVPTPHVTGNDDLSDVVIRVGNDQEAPQAKDTPKWLPYAVVACACILAFFVIMRSALSGTGGHLAGGVPSATETQEETATSESAKEEESSPTEQPEEASDESSELTTDNQSGFFGQDSATVNPENSGPDVPESAVASETFDGHTYALFDINSDWQGARDVCVAFEGHLATITSEEEQQVIEDLLANGTRNNYWIGGSLVAPQTWAWITGETFEYTNWGEGAPDNWIVLGDDGNANGADPDDITMSENALAVYRVKNPKAPHEPGMWNDLANDGDCNGEAFFGLDNIGFICEWDEA